MHAVTLYRLGGQGSSWGGVVRSRVRLVERGRRVGADEAVPALSAFVPQGAFGPDYPSSGFSIVNNGSKGKSVRAGRFSYLRANEPGSCRFAVSRARQRLSASSSGWRCDQSSRCVSLPHAIAIKWCAPCCLPSWTGIISVTPS